MSKTKLGFVVSASMMIIASQAMAHAGKDVPSVIEFPSISVDSELQARVNSALEKRDVRLAIGEVLPVLMNSYGRDGGSIVQRVAQNTQAEGGNYDHTYTSPDLVNPNSGEVSVTCHSACHSACHGSRGWR